MGAVCAAALALLLAATTLAAAQPWQPGDQLPAFSVPTLGGTLHVGRDAADAAAGGRRSAGHTNVPAGGPTYPSGPLVVVCYDGAHPGSRVMWREPASLDALLTDAPADAHFLLLPLNETTAKDDAAWMRRQLQERAAALHLAPADLGALFARLHFATSGLAALGGPLPALLQEQWQELWPAVLAVPVGFSGDAAELERAAGPPPVGLPAPKQAEPANSTEAQLAGQQPGNGTAGSSGGGSQPPGGKRPAGAAASNVTASNATQAAPGVPRLLAYTLETSSFWVYERLASLEANLSVVLAGTDCRWLPSSGPDSASQQPTAIQGAAALVTLSQWPSRNPAAPCSWHALLMGAAQGGAAAVLFAAPPGTGPDLQQPDCEGSSEACSHPPIAAATVGNRFGRALLLALKGSERVNVTFGGVRGPGMYAGILPDGRLFEAGAGSAATPSLAAAVWEAQGRAYLQQVEEQASARLAAPGTMVVPVFTEALMPQGEGVRATVEMPGATQLRGLDRVELDLQLGCPGASDTSCPEWDHVVQLFVCCQDPDSVAPPCDVCRKTPWSLPPDLAAGLTPGSLSLGVAPGTSTTSSSSGDGNGSSSSFNGSGANRTTRAIRDDPASQLPHAQLARQCGRELGRWVSPYRRGIGRWLTDASPLLPLLVPGQQCTFTMQSTDWAGTWRPSLTLLFSRGEAAGEGSSGAASSGGGSALRSARAKRVAMAPAAAPAATRALPRPASLRVASSNSSMGGGIALDGGDAQPLLPAASGGSAKAARLLPLPWPGGTLDASYNRRQQPFQFKTPAGVQRALLVATITGHSQDSLFNCAEFCPAEHVFAVNGAQQNVSHGAAGTLFGCAEQIGQGTVPNQLGTWTLGRAGWCPGGAAVPWVADITDQLLPVGELNLLEYQALLPGGKAPGEPPDVLPQDLATNATALDEELRRGSGHIMLEASLVLYTS